MIVKAGYGLKLSALVAVVIAFMAGCTPPEERKQSAYDRGLELVAAGEHQKAVLEFRTAIQIDSTFTEARYQLGQSLLALGYHAAAASEFERVGREDPERGMALKPMLAEALVEAGEYERGGEVCRALIAEGRGTGPIYDLHSRVLINEAKASLETATQSNPRGSIAMLAAIEEAAGKALELDPTLAQPHVTRASAAIYRHRYVDGATAIDEASMEIITKEFALASDKAPDDTVMLRHIASLWSLAGAPEESMRAIELALSADPEDGAAQLVKAELLFEAGRVDDSLALAERLTEDGDGGTALDFLLGRLWLAKGDVGRARDVLRGAAGNPYAAYYYGLCLEKEGDIQQALGQYENVLSKVPDHIGAQRARFEIFLRERNLTKSQLIADEAVESSPDDVAGYLMQARALDVAGDLAGALRATETALQRAPASTEVQLFKALLLQRTRRHAEAVALLRDVADRTPESAAVQFALADTLVATKAWDEAEFVARRGLKLAPENPGAHIALAKILIGAGDLAGAAEAYEAASAVAPDDTSIKMDWASVNALGGNFERSASILQGVAADDSRYVQSQLQLAEVLELGGDVAGAQALYRRLAAEHPNAADATSGLFNHLFRNSAIEEAERLASQNENDVLGHVMLSEMYSFREDWPRAIAELKEAALLEPESSALRTRLGQVYMRAKQYPAALETLETALRLQPESSTATLGKALALIHLDQLAAAERYCEERLAARPGDLNIALALADSLALQERDSEAESRYRELIEGRPDFLLPYLRIAHFHESRGQFAESEAAMQSAIAAAPNAVNLHLEYGEFLERRGKPEGAREAYARAIELAPNQTEGRALLATLAASLGDLETAEAQLRIQLDARPRDLKTALNLAVLLQRRGRADEGGRLLHNLVLASEDPGAMALEISRLLATVKELDTLDALAGGLLEDDPDNWIAEYARGTVLSGQGKHEEARVHFAKAAALNPATPITRHAEAVSFVQSGEPDSALEAFESARGIDATFIPGYTDAAGVLIAQGDLAAAARLCERALEASPDDFSVQIMLAGIHARAGRPAEALRLAEGAIGDGGGAVPAFAVAEELSGNGHHDAAVSLGKRAAAADAENMSLVLRLAQIYQRAGKLEEAEGAYRQLVVSAPDASAPRNNLAGILVARGRLEEALAQAEKARELTPDNPAILDTLGWVHYLLGDMEKAVPLLEAAAAGISGNPEILYHLASAYTAEGRKNDARPLLEAALAAGDSFSVMEEAKALLREVQ